MSREVPSGWQSTHLREVANQVSEKWESGDEPDATYVGLEHIGQASGMLLATGTSRELTSPKSRFQPNDVLFGKLRPNLRKTAFASFPGVSSTDIIVLRAQPEIEPRFLFYRVSAEDCFNHAVRSAAGTKMPRTTWTDLGDFEFGLPTIPEQGRISAILSSVDEAIQTTQAVIDQTRTVKQGVLERLLTKGIGHTRFKRTEIGEIPESWSVSPLGLAIRLRRGFAFKSDDYVDSGVLSFRVSNVGRDPDDLGSTVYLPEPFLDLFSEYRLGGEEIVIVMVGATVGKLGRVPAQICPALLNQNMWHLQPRDNVDQDYLWQALPTLVSNHMDKGQGGAYTFLSTKSFLKESIALPPLREQEEIASIISQFDASLDDSRQELKQLTRLKRTLLSELITGRVRVPADLPMAAE